MWIWTYVWILAELRITHRKRSIYIHSQNHVVMALGNATADSAAACYVQAAERALISGFYQHGGYTHYMYTA